MRGYLVVLVGVIATATAMFCAAEDVKEQRTSRVYFTTDDGQTWFADAASRVPPFAVDGREAVRAFVFTTESNTRLQFVAYLMKYTADAKAILEKRREANKPMEPDEAEILLKGTLIKRPGGAKWMPAAEAKDATAVKGAGGAAAVQVLP